MITSPRGATIKIEEMALSLLFASTLSFFKSEDEDVIVIELFVSLRKVRCFFQFFKPTSLSLLLKKVQKRTRQRRRNEKPKQPSKSERVSSHPTGAFFFFSLCLLFLPLQRAARFLRVCQSRFLLSFAFFFFLNPKRQKTSFFSRPQTKVLFIGEVRGYNLLHTRSLKNIFNKSSSSG